MANILIVEVYVLILGYKVDEVEELCDIIQEILDNGNLRKTPSNWEAETLWLEINQIENIGGSLGLGKRNQRDQMLNNFYVGNGLVNTNTWFKKSKRKLNTWKAPVD
jgi:hypothetical protein